MAIQQKTGDEIRPTGLIQSKVLARQLIQITEPIWLCAMVIAFWYHSPPIRDEWVWLVFGCIPIFALRWWGYGRLWTNLSFHWVSLAFIALSIFNYTQAPYARTDYWVLMVRPLLGLWLAIYCVELTRQAQSLRPLIIVSLVGGGIVAWLGLTATQWTVKSESFSGILNSLPIVDYRTHLPDMLLSFNVNEMGGALTWVVPLLLGTALISPSPDAKPVGRFVRVTAGIIGGFALLALMLGQSRFAIGGVLGGLLLMPFLMLQGKKRLIVGGLVSLLILLQIGLLIDLPARFNQWVGQAPTTISASDTPPPTDLLSDRDQSTLTQRLEIWQRSLAMIGDYPLTGVGMSMFYLAVRYEPYIVSQLENRPPPHAHNEWLQIGTDLGIAGMVLFAFWHGIILWYLGRIIHSQWATEHDSSPRSIYMLSVVLLCSILPHMVFGIGDAIKLWDRYAFLWWWVMGFSCAVYYVWAQNSKNKFHEYKWLW